MGKSGFLYRIDTIYSIEATFLFVNIVLYRYHIENE